ncbi:pelota family protein [Candidatus Micrarchaeota archaeon]|nr:pelota family protein [Candidatus Micrarchaeota archaeon]
MEFAEAALKLRLTGPILSGTPEEFVPKGAHHTLDVEPHTRFVLKKKFSAYDWAILNEAKKRAKHVKAFLIAMDEHKATMAELQLAGLNFVGEVDFKGTKRDPKAFEEAVKGYFHEILSFLEGKERVVVAGPGFAADNFKKYLKEKKPALLEKTSFEHCSSAEKSGVYELLKRGVIEKALGEQRVAKEFSLMEEFRESIGREDRKCVYGLKDVEAAVEANAARTVMATESALKDKKIDSLLEAARKKGAEIYVFAEDDEPAKELDAYKLVALLRYPLWL